MTTAQTLEAEDRLISAEVAALGAHLEALPWDLDVARVAVDSGQLGLVDPSYEPFTEEDQWAHLNSGDSATTAPNLGVIVAPAFGDGLYPVHVLRSATGVVLAVTVQFVHPRNDGR